MAKTTDLALLGPPVGTYCTAAIWPPPVVPQLNLVIVALLGTMLVKDDLVQVAPTGCDWVGLVVGVGLVVVGAAVVGVAVGEVLALFDEPEQAAKLPTARAPVAARIPAL